VGAGAFGNWVGEDGGGGGAVGICRENT